MTMAAGDEGQGQSEGSISTIFVAYPYSFSEADYRGAFQEVTEDFEVKFVFADERITSVHILEKITGMLREAEFSLFDITTWNPNVALELGIAVGAELDYYILFNPTTGEQDVPADLGGIDRIQYRDYAELKAGLRKLMTQQFGSPEPEPTETAGKEIVEGVNALRQKIPEVVGSEPGLQIGGIASAVGVEVDMAQVLVKPLVGQQLVTRGVKRGTRYYVPGDAPPEDAESEAAGSQPAQEDTA
jgi:hypothetical protein